MVTKDKLERFATIIGAEITDVIGTDDTRVLVFQPDGMEKGTMDVDRLAPDPDRDRDDPVISASASATYGGAAGLTVEAPATQWELIQTVDDGNLYTALRLPETETGMTASLGVHGPPAQYSHDGIELEMDGDNPSEYLLDQN